MGESLVGHIPSKDNITDLLTKVLYGQNRKYWVSNILYDRHDDYYSETIEDDRMHNVKIKSIGNSFNFEGTRLMGPCMKPGKLIGHEGSNKQIRVNKKD